MKTITMICDCGCGERSGNDVGWLRLTQEDMPQTNNLDAKLYKELHFKSLKCLQTWADKANKSFPRLRASAEGLSPRGMIEDTNVMGLYV